LNFDWENLLKPDNKGVYLPKNKSSNLSNEDIENKFRAKKYAKDLIIVKIIF